MKWKVLSSKYLAKDPPWFTVRVDKVQLPNKKVLDNYYVLEYPEWACIIALTKSNQIVMVEQYRHAIGKIGLELPAGVVDNEDSNVMVAAKRELLEETGYGNGEWDSFMTISANPGTHSNLAHIFLARNVEFIQNPKLDDTEEINVHLLEIEELKKALSENKILQSMHAAPLWKLIAEKII